MRFCIRLLSFGNEKVLFQLDLERFRSTTIFKFNGNRTLVRAHELVIPVQVQTAPSLWESHEFVPTSASLEQSGGIILWRDKRMPRL